MATTKTTDNPLSLEQLQKLAADEETARAATLAIVTTLASEDEEVRGWAADVLENLGVPPDQSLSKLAELTRSSEAPVAAWSCKLIGRLGEQAQSEESTLASALTSHPVEGVREEAAWALGQLPSLTNETRAALATAASQGSPRLKRLAIAASQR